MRDLRCAFAINLLGLVPDQQQEKLMTIIKKILITIFSVFLGLVLLLFLFKEQIGRLLGAAPPHEYAISEGNIPVPVERSYTSSKQSPVKDSVLRYWSSKVLPNWIEERKVTAPRVAIANLFSGRKIKETNTYLQEQKSVGISGSTWEKNPEGDYDFTLAGLTPLLFFFGDSTNILYPETVDNLLNVLLIEEGGEFNGKVPKTYGFVYDTENHILMTEGSRYLKNLWLWNHSNKAAKYNNLETGLEEKLFTYMQKIYEHGVFEFNSDPYIAYTIMALLNLQAFGEGRIKETATNILDRINWQYSLSSYKLRRFPPYRRQYERAHRTALGEGYHTAAMKMWLSFYDAANQYHVNRGEHVALWAGIFPYRPADKVIDWTLEKKHAYYVKIGHGYESCPEIYSGHPGYLISGGGANQGERSLIVARPIVVLLDDEAEDLKETFHMYGPGEDFMEWNNTGVYKDFAVAAGSVHIPAGHQPLAQNGNWEVYQVDDEVFMLIYSINDLGIIAIHTGNADPSQLLKEVITLNPDETQLYTRFKHLNGKEIGFDLKATKDQWVITAINGVEQDRNFHRWPHMDGEL